MADLFNLQGKIKLSAIAVNNTLRQAPVKMYYVGRTPNASIALGQQEFPHFEAESGDRLQDGVLYGGKTGSVTSALEELSPENMELVLHSVKSSQSTTPITDMEIPTVAEGDEFALPHVKVTSLSIEDSQGTPVTLPSGQYTLDADFGKIVFDDITTGGPYTQPFKVSYTPGSVDSLPVFTQDTPPERLLHFEAINTINGEKMLIELYRVQIPVGFLDALKHNEGAVGNIPFNPKILADTTRPVDDVLGQFGRVIPLG